MVRQSIIATAEVKCDGAQRLPELLNRIELANISHKLVYTFEHSRLWPRQASPFQATSIPRPFLASTHLPASQTGQLQRDTEQGRGTKLVRAVQIYSRLRNLRATRMESRIDWEIVHARCRTIIRGRF